MTDAYGRFSIEAEQGKTLVISNMGYNAREIKIQWRDHNIIVGLQISTSKLDEVQIVAIWKEHTTVPNRECRICKSCR